MSVTMAPDVAAQYAERVLVRYGLPATTTLQLLNISENATFCVGGSDETPASILRVHRPGYSTLPEIKSELAWTAALRSDAGLRTASVISAIDGARVVEVESRSDSEPVACVMFELLPGSEPPDDDLEYWFERLGEISARMHAQARSWSPPAGFVRRTWDVATTIGPKGIWGRWQDAKGLTTPESQLLDRAAQRIEARLGAYGKGASRFGLVHADLRVANLLVDGDDISIIDFDDSGYSWYLYDVATALTFLEHTAAAPALVEAWIRGYSRVASLSPDDLGEIPTFLMMRRLLVLAWITSHDATDTAASQADSYARETVELADRFLSSGPATE